MCFFVTKKHVSDCQSSSLHRVLCGKPNMQTPPIKRGELSAITSIRQCARIHFLKPVETPIGTCYFFVLKSESITPDLITRTNTEIASGRTGKELRPTHGQVRNNANGRTRRKT